MNPAMSTALQSWSRPKLVSVGVLLFLLHLGVFLMGVALAPSMFHDAQVPGTVCVKQNEENTWYEGKTSETRCLPTDEKEPRIRRLSESILAFRFPTEFTQPSYYSRWNWRLLGSLYLSLSFNEDDYYESDFEKDNNVTAAFAVNRRNVPVSMEAKLDASFESSFNEGLYDENFRLFEWERLSEIKDNRKLQCTVTSMQPGISSMVDYSCTLTPLFAIELLSNQSYILQLSFKPPIPKNDTSDDIFDNFGITETPVQLKQISLTLIVEDRGFHAALFYLKCLCVPFILGALVVFGIRLYLNDLYVSIPDRLLVTCAFAQIIHNIPVEALIAEGSFWEVSPYLKLLDELSRILLITCLFLFWIVYTKDKISTKEPWERNTRYYWRQIVFIIIGGLMAVMWAVYNRGPSMSNAFKNHWQVETVAVLVSLGLIFALAGLALAYQTALSVLVFRALCDISVVHYRQHYCSASGRSFVPHRIWRIKMVLLYSFAVSVFTIGGLILHLAMELSLHWNPQFYLNPVPFHLTFASAYILGLNGLWNLHILTLLFMLARSTSSSTNSTSHFNNTNTEDYVRPVNYTCAAHSLDDFRLQNVCSSGDENECVLDSLTSNHFSSGGESNLKRRQSSEDFLEMQAARENQYHIQHCHHFVQDQDCSSTPDPFEEEAMVDDYDPLEMARQGTVHIWENDVICHGLSDDFLRIAGNMSPTESPNLGTSDDAVLYQ